MQQYFHDLADHLQRQLRPGEDYTAWLSGERSDFVRFNHGKVRQAGEVAQSYLTLRLIQDARHSAVTLSLTGQGELDRQTLTGQLQALRDELRHVAEDPHLLLSTEVRSSERITRGSLPPAASLVDTVTETAAGHDLVGFLAAGPTYEGFANSYGQRNWHQAESFNFDWSVYAGGDKAVKSAYAGTDWRPETFREKFHAALQQLERLRQPARTLGPGGYRAYLAPAALDEIIGMLNWGGLSEKALRTKRSPLLKLAEGEARLAPAVGFTEHTAEGLAPAFQGEGFLRPDRIPLVEAGELVGSLVSPRTAREYGIDTNGVGGGESAQSLQMDAGQLPEAQVLSELGEGLYVGNLWYLNYSDRANARLTGMTRFATFWVENGRIAAPVNVMRFDDSLYRILGSELEGLTAERELIVETGTYGGRETASRLLPGALVRELRLVL